MNKFMGMAACLIVAIDCAGKAVGIEPQSQFSADYLWIWWLVAAVWAVAAVGVVRS